MRNFWHYIVIGSKRDIWIRFVFCILAGLGISYFSAGNTILIIGGLILFVIGYFGSLYLRGKETDEIK